MWRHSLKNWENVSKDCYDFAFQQGEKRLKDILDESEKITTRTYALIGIVVPIISINLGVLINNLNNKDVSIVLSLFSIVTTLVLGLCLWFLYELISSRDTWYNGTEPKSIVKSEFMELENLVNDEPVKNLIKGELEIIQQKIDCNSQINANRIITFSICLKIIIVTTIAAIVSLLLFFMSNHQTI